MTTTIRSEAVTAVHEMIVGFHVSGAVDEHTMREFNETCLPPAFLSMFDEMKVIREK